jgi:hypothetical protein
MASFQLLAHAQGRNVPKIRETLRSNSFVLEGLHRGPRLGLRVLMLRKSNQQWPLSRRGLALKEQPHQSKAVTQSTSHPCLGEVKAESVSFQQEQLQHG